MGRVERRKFLWAAAVLHGVPLLIAAKAFAQSPQRVRRIAYFGANSPAASPDAATLVQAWHEGLRSRGWVEGQNLAVEYRWVRDTPEAALDFARVPAQMKEVVNIGVELIYADSAFHADAARKVTSSVPIVCPFLGDPIAGGFVTSLARPDMNVTGISIQATDVRTKALEFLIEVVPGAKGVAVLFNPVTKDHAVELAAVRQAGAKLGIRVQDVAVSLLTDLEPAFERIARERLSAVQVFGGPPFFPYARQIAELGVRHRLATVGVARSYANAGMLMSYGANNLDVMRRSARYVDSILRGARVADLPIEQIERFELVVNIKTAKALGQAIPRALLARADHLIE